MADLKNSRPPSWQNPRVKTLQSFIKGAPVNSHEGGVKSLTVIRRHLTKTSCPGELFLSYKLQSAAHGRLKFELPPL